MLSDGMSSISNYCMSLLIFYMQSVGGLQMLTPGSHLVFSINGPVDQKRLFCLGSYCINLCFLSLPLLFVWSTYQLSWLMTLFLSRDTKILLRGRSLLGLSLPSESYPLVRRSWTGTSLRCPLVCRTNLYVFALLKQKSYWINYWCHQLYKVDLI